jgi:hypothetical protein
MSLQNVYKTSQNFKKLQRNVEYLESKNNCPDKTKS